tara:strand:- start:415 stop:618 length:204 start_codon:yes stop_codon:yes gene_type:complete
MKKFKSISVDEATFNEIVNLSKSLLPKVILSKSQTIEKIVDIAKNTLATNQEKLEPITIITSPMSDE